MIDRPTLLIEVAEWLAARPAIHELAIAFPPGCKVTSREDAPLLVPAPGTIGIVISYYEEGLVGVVAELDRDVTSPVSGVTLEKGEPLKGQCDPGRLVLVECDSLTQDDVRELLGRRRSDDLVVDGAA